MTFLNHTWLYLTPLVFLAMLGLTLLGLRRKDKILTRFVAARLMDQLATQGSSTRIFLKSFCIILSATFIAFAMARPQLGVEYTERQARGLDIVFILDTSKSMLATDLRPSRLDRAKLAIRDIISRLESDRIGLVAFAGNAFLQTPPTLDFAAFRESLDSIGPEIMSRGGSNIGSALREAANAFPQENNFKVCILLTDGEDLDGDALETAEAIASEKITVHTIGIGTPEGDYLRIRNDNGREELIRDAEGNPVRSQLDEATLQQIAQATGGAYFRLSNQSLNTLYQSVLSTLPRQELSSEMQEVRIERFQWFIGTAIILAILESLIRRRKQSATLALLITCLLAVPLQPGEAQITPQASSQGSETAEPPTLPDNPKAIYNLGVEQLASGDYIAANSTFDQAIQQSNDRQLQADALFNQAHAINQLGEEALQKQDFGKAVEHWKDAEARFQSAHEIAPSDTEAAKHADQLRARREALEEFLKEQEQQQEEPQQNQDSSQEEEQESSEQEQEDSEQGDSQQDDSQQGDSQQDEQEGQSSEEQSSDSESSESSESQSQEGEEAQEPSEEEGPESTESADDASQAQDAQESTGNPADDLPQPGDESEEGSEEAAASEPEDPSNPEGAGHASATQADQGEVTEESISLREARALLDSLQEKERLLPFTPSQPGDRPSDLRDW